MLHDPTRHEPVAQADWNEAAARALIAHIVADTEAAFIPGRYWPAHPLDNDGSDATASYTPLYLGAGGTFWALDYLKSIGATQLKADYSQHYETLIADNRAWLDAEVSDARASYLMGDTPILMMAYGALRTDAIAQELASLIAANVDHPTRELMWGAPGTLLASLFLHRLTGDMRWAELYRMTADKLWSQLSWSPDHDCHYWVQDLYGKQSTYLDGVHGFVATAVPLIAGRDLLNAASWQRWQQCIVDTITHTAVTEAGKANWPIWLYPPAGSTPRWLMQFCHGAPGFVVCLAQMPGNALDALLAAAGEAIWAAGPLKKGSNLCHGTGGNGYAFLALYQRTGDVKWLERARAFAMHGIAQTQEAERRYGQLRYSLWTGDLGFAIYLWDCLHGTARFPTLEVFYAP